MSTGFFAKLFGAVALAGLVMAPVSMASANSLEDEFDLAFAALGRVAAPAFANRASPASSYGQPHLGPGGDMPFAAPGNGGPASFGLEAHIASLADPRAGRIGVAAIDLSSGRSVGVMADVPFPMASTSKVAIIATFLEGVDLGRFSLDQRFPLMVPLKSLKFSSRVAPVRPGEWLGAYELIERTLIHSDNQATDALLAAVGGPAAVNRWLRATGNSGLHLDRDIATLVRDDGAVNPANTVDRRDSATPMAMVRLLAGLYQGQWLSPQSRSVLLGTMQRCLTGKNRLRAQLPPDARVAHKTGTLANTTSDVGLVQTPDGRIFAMAIYVTGQGSRANRETRIASIARAIYDGYQTVSASSRSFAQR